MTSESNAAPTPEEVLPRLGPLVREKIIIDDRAFVLQRPQQSDRLLENPAIFEAFDRDQYIPYWADLWPAARMLAKAILRETWTPGQAALEVGCGLGLPGIAALAAGLRVTFSDYDPCALRFAGDNARLNGFEDFRTLSLDWRYPPPDLRVPILLASDLSYELRNVEPIVSFIKQVLLPGGLCLLTDQDRTSAFVLRETLERQDLTFTTRLMRAGEPGGRRLKGTLYRITQAA